jgi:hypothetical protein
MPARQWRPTSRPPRMSAAIRSISSPPHATAKHAAIGDRELRELHLPLPIVRSLAAPRSGRQTIVSIRSGCGSMTSSPQPIVRPRATQAGEPSRCPGRHPEQAGGYGGSKSCAGSTDGLRRRRRGARPGSLGLNRIVTPKGSGIVSAGRGGAPSQRAPTCSAANARRPWSTAWSPITRGTLFCPPSRPRLLSQREKPPGGIGSTTGSFSPVGTARRSS